MRATLLFVTDPLCAWCWGTLPEIEATRRRLGDALEFDLVMAGLRVGTDAGLAEYDKGRLQRLWREVRQVTGQIFSEKLPADFVFDSTRPCRAIEIARHESGEPPWTFFQRLQSAFFVDGRDINATSVLAELMEMAPDELGRRLEDPTYADAVAANVDLVNRLSANALPNIQLDTGDGFRLVSGGYIAADYLVPALRERLAA